MPIIETRTTMLREKPLDQLDPPTPVQRQNWVQRTLVTNRLPIVANWEPMDATPLQAHVNQGRWLVDCPACRGAEMADPDWLFFACCSCGAGVWPVVFPPERAAIEAALLERPHASFMSWDWDMSVAELLAAGPFHHSWTAPRTYVTGEIVTASILNIDHRDNLLETAPALVTTAGDIVYATAANAMARLALGTLGYRLLAGASAPEYKGSARVHKTTDQSIPNSIILEDDTFLKIAIPANTIWVFDLALFMGGPTGADIKIAFKVPTGFNSLKWSAIALSVGATAINQVEVSATQTVDDGSRSLGTLTGTNTSAHVWGTIDNGANAGNLQLRWAQVVADGTGCSIFKDSWLRGEEV